MFNMAAKVESIHVPYRGSGPMQADLIGGQIDFSFDPMPVSTAQVKGGKLFALAQNRVKRGKGFPDVPTLDEQGFKGFYATSLKREERRDGQKVVEIGEEGWC